ncbi:MAG: AraC family transcriptional [Prolixibacteraceae bacterium]|nr:MAG: AraC family transcriptional [Prolixibacteraceae bacterium]
MNNNEFKYLTISEEDSNWGLFLNVAGTANILPSADYPSPNHPSEYFFTWEKGRILNEFQINFITEGAGILENRFGTFLLKKGSIFFTFPGVWHRYKPNFKTGWTENYIGFNGELAGRLIFKPLFSPEEPVYYFGIKEELLDTFLKIFDLVEKEQPGYQQIASGMVIKLLGYIISFEKQKDFSGKPIAKVIEAIRFEMRRNMQKEIDLKTLAEKHNVSYSFFRKMFKKYTGVSPGQYLLQLRITRAKELLISTDKSIKEISYELGFQSIFYFSNMFKKKEGVTPSYFRNKNNI